MGNSALKAAALNSAVTAAGAGLVGAGLKAFGALPSCLKGPKGTLVRELIKGIDDAALPTHKAPPPYQSPTSIVRPINKK